MRDLHFFFLTTEIHIQRDTQNKLRNNYAAQIIVVAHSFVLAALAIVNRSDLAETRNEITATQIQNGRESDV